jgi:hypothetical protein
VNFDGDRVSGWSNADSRLRLSLPGAATRTHATFMVGSTKAEVAAVQGVPTSYYPGYWQYGLATVNFEGDRVSGWSNAAALRLSLPGAGTQPQGRFGVGASKDEVASVQGIPSSYYPSYWQYGLATVNFEGNHVSGWSNAGTVLKVN